ncbi:hypothetical protein CIG75_06975 [Tumebacillus algifaecis]|uniref:Small, acid-soluble spore protein, alpha/beta type n=1 Tax=Tumebacillus algifaecis TaxID=1214604 RepID=A0A223CZH6_9BACL|nr:hypothetical protein [Tumebacillus algifaecis]ASS74741.1 hypothetical protein CIG75_06975 [Tumebacillus algifaecis]
MYSNYDIPDAYHPNKVDLHLEEVQQQVLEQFGLSEQVEQQGMESLSAEQAAAVGLAMSKGFESLASPADQLPK